GFGAVTSVIPNRFDFYEGETGNEIGDGGDDMYDGGNLLSTDLGGALDYSNGIIVDNAVFGSGGRYFTRTYPGLFVLAGDLDGVATRGIMTAFLAQLPVQWLRVAPSSGTTPQGASEYVAVTFDASGLIGGEYEAVMRVASNDPDEAEVDVPVHMHVTGAPNLTLSTNRLDYGNVFIGVPRSLTLTITNTGTDVLNVASVSSDSPRFSADISSFSL